MLYASLQMLQKRPKTKTAVMSLRVDPQIKAAAEQAAKLEHRSLTSFVEVLILKHCGGIATIAQPRGENQK